MHHILHDFLQNNKKLTLIRKDKRDKNKGKTAFAEWPTKHYYADEIDKHQQKGGNIAWVLDDTDLVIDVDVIDAHGNKKEGFESQKKLFDDLGINLQISARSGSGGYYYYLKLPKPMPQLRKTLKEYPHIDFLKKGNYVIIPPSIHQTYKKLYTLENDKFVQTEAPKLLIDLLSKGNFLLDNDTKIESNDNFLEQVNLSNMTLKDIKGTLYEINPHSDYTTWLRCGMALSYFDDYNNTEEGFNLWNIWSEQSEKYPGLREMKQKWASFKNSNLSNNEKIKPETIKYLAKEERIEKTKSQGDIEWKNRWCRDNSDKNCIVEITNPINRVTEKHFNMQFSHLCPPQLINNKLKKQKPVDFLYKEGYLKHVNFTSYRPDVSTQFFTDDGINILNSFSPSSIPPRGDKHDSNYNKVVNMFMSHLKFLCSNNKEDTHKLLYWLAHNVQYPGKTIKWGILLKGEETNTGKTWVGTMLEKVLGSNNYKVINTADVQSDFNEWATGACVVLIDEIKVPGTNRYTIANKLKPYITNDTISINKKCVSVHKVKNTTNYIATSNDADAIPMLEDQSRWFPIHVYGHKTVEEKKQHNAMLVDLLDNYPHLIATYLHQVKIPASFATRDAPTSSHLVETIKLEREDMLGGESALDLLNDPTENNPWNKHVVNVTEFFNCLYFTDPDSVEMYKKSPKRKGLFFKRLGYPHTFKVIENGKNITYRTKNKIRTIEEVHHLLNVKPDKPDKPAELDELDKPDKPAELDELDKPAELDELDKLDKVELNHVKSEKTPAQIKLITNGLDEIKPSSTLSPPYNPDHVKTNWCGKQTLDVLDVKTNTVKNICINPDNYTFNFETGYFIHKETGKVKKRLSKKDHVFTWVMLAQGEKPKRSNVNSKKGHTL